MKREIGFRGKNLKTGEWVYGDLFHERGPLKTSIIPWDRLELVPVDPDSVGENTGLEDMKKEPIFEGDILAQDGEPVGFPVRYEKESCTACDGVTGVYGFACKYDLYSISRHENLVVIGNVYDNPEMVQSEDW